MKTAYRLILTAAALAICNFAATVQAEDYTYTTNNGTITITGYIGPGGVVTIPDNINGLPVTSIGDRAFYNCGSVTSIIVPNGIITIGGWAFYVPGHCSSLTNITIPDSVTTIGSCAFGECFLLTSIKIPKSVTSIGEGAFAQCASLTGIDVAPENPAYSSIRGGLVQQRPNHADLLSRG